MSKTLNHDEYINKHVRIKHASYPSYKKKEILGAHGIITRVSSNKFGVLVDGKTNTCSSYGVFWFDIGALEILENESEDMNMTGFKNVAIVNLLDDYNKKDYGFAVYDEEFNLIVNSKSKVEDCLALVVTNARGKDNRVLGKVKSIVSIEEYGKSVTAQIVGVVNMDAYNARVEEENRLAEIAKKKAEIEKALDAEIKKRKDVEYYEKMAKEYSDNPLIVKLAAELKGLGA